MRPLLSFTFPQGFQISKKKIGHPTQRANDLKIKFGAKKIVKTKFWYVCGDTKFCGEEKKRKKKLWQNSKTQIVTTLKTQIVTKLKNSSCDQTQQFQ